MNKMSEIENSHTDGIALAILARARDSGTVLNLKDRRHDLYSVTWKNKE